LFHAGGKMSSVTYRESSPEAGGRVSWVAGLDFVLIQALQWKMRQMTPMFVKEVKPF